MRLTSEFPRVLVALLLASISAPIAATPPGAKTASAPAFTRTAEARVSETTTPGGVWIGKTAHVVYDFVQPGEGHAKGRTLLSQQFSREERSDREGTTASVVVTALRSGAQPYDTTLWSIKTPADEGKVREFDGLYETLKHGCCGAEDLHRFFDLGSGKGVVAFSSNAAFASAQDRRFDRIVTYLGMMASHADVPYPDERDVAGVLTLSAYDRVVDRVAVVLAKPEDTGSPNLTLALAKDPDSGGTWLRLDRPKGATSTREVVSGLVVTLDWGQKTTGTIPITQDGFDASHAVAPKGFAFRKLQP